MGPQQHGQVQQGHGDRLVVGDAGVRRIIIIVRE